MNRFFIVVLVLILTFSVTAQKYADGRPEATLKMDAKDHGIVLRFGDRPDKYDILGARDVWVFEDHGTYYMHYDAAGPKGWLSSLAIRKYLINWEKKGPILDFGKAGEDDSKSAAYGVTYLDNEQWHLVYLGTPNVSEALDLVPSFAYLTLNAKVSSLSVPWIKQTNAVPFRTKVAIYYSITESPGQVIKQGKEYLQFFSATTYRNTSQYPQRTLGIARIQDLVGNWTVDAEPLLLLKNN